MKRMAGVALAAGIGYVAGHLLARAIGPLVPWPPVSLDDVLKLLGLLGAASFFAWKAMTGWFIINLNVELSAERAGPDGEVLLITVKLEKGSTDALWLTGAQARVSEVTLTDITRCGPLPKGDGGNVFSLFEVSQWDIRDNKLQWNVQRSPSRPLTLSPGEKLAISTGGYVNPSAAYRVDVAITGVRTFWHRRGFQWRVSALSLPTKAGAA